MAAQYGKDLTLQGGDLNLYITSSVLLTHVQCIGLICSNTSLVRSLHRCLATTRTLSFYYSSLTCPYKELHGFDARQR